MEESRSNFKILTYKPTGKRHLQSSRLRWEDSIRLDLKEIDVNTSNWFDSAQYRDYWRALADVA